jgi:arabinogalactan endo-1,4-beta-galactosidase
MIEKKIALITIHDINPSCAEKLQLIADELNKLKVKYNLSVVPYYDKKLLHYYREMI